MKFVVKENQEMASKTVRFPVKLMDKLNEIAMQHNISVNALIQQCTVYALRNMEGIDGKQI
jgi:predicted HicB family RNase H-like nuclease